MIRDRLGPRRRQCQARPHRRRARRSRSTQIPCPILPERRKFDAAVEAALPLCPAPAVHAVTMTGELSDVFGDRAEGVAYLVAMMREGRGGAGASYLCAAEPVFSIPTIQAAEHARSGLGQLACDRFFGCRRHADALLVDVGTTTTDLIPIKAGAVAARGYTDGERLTEGELLYTGVVRTPVMAMARTAPFRGRVQRIAAERFATMADVWRLTGELPGRRRSLPRADRRGKSTQESASAARPHARARRKRGRACRVDGARALFRRLPARRDRACGARSRRARRTSARTRRLIGAAAGASSRRRLAERLGRPYLDFAELIDAAPEAREMAARCAPAVAVALLAAKGE